MSEPARTKQRRYAVLWHSGVDAPHFDLLLETLPGSDLATWRLPAWPVMVTAEAVRLKDHRRIYLDYEGDLSGHRGQVQRIDAGECQLEIGQDAVWRVEKILGTGFHGTIVLRQISGERWMVSVE